ncbi:MAG: PAS domain S-box protein, partial [Gammaproteobacteria bacterium]|nr:PAS domain S-box protein [Gammaproteobacteria bacterium]
MAGSLNPNANAPPMARPAQDLDSPGTRCLVLIADPDPASRRDRLQALKRAGFAVVAASSGAEMLNLMLRRRPAIALICESLPGLSAGVEAHLSGADARIPGMATLWIGSGDSPATPAVVDAWIRGSASPLELVAYAQILARLQRAERRCLELEGQADPTGPDIARLFPPTDFDAARPTGSEQTPQFQSQADPPRAFDPVSLSADQLRRLLDLAPEAIAITREHTLVYVNAAFLNLVRARETSAVLGRSHLDLFHPGYRAQARKRIRRALVEGRVVRSPEERFRRLDGTAVAVEVAAARCETDHGPAVMIFVRDITRRKRLEESLRRRESQLRLIMDSTPALISYVDTEGRYVSVNKSYERHFGVAPEQILGQHVREVLGEPGWQAAQPFVKRALAGESVAFEQRIPYLHGGARWVSATYTADRDETGAVRGFIAQVMDVSERKATEAELWASEQRFRQIAQSLSHVFWMTELCPERVLYVSPAFQEIWGRSPEELYANPRVWTEAIHAD